MGKLRNLFVVSSVDTAKIVPLAGRDVPESTHVLGREKYRDEQVPVYFGGDNWAFAGLVSAWDIGRGKVADAKYILHEVVSDIAKQTGAVLYTHEGRRLMLSPTGISILPEIKTAFLAIWRNEDERAARLEGRKLRRVMVALNRILRGKGALKAGASALAKMGFTEGSKIPYRRVCEALGLGYVSKKTGVFAVLPDVKTALAKILGRPTVGRLTVDDVFALFASQGVEE